MDVQITPRRLSGVVTPPPSKSLAHRWILAAALAAGGKTYKLKYGHRGVNQPVRDLGGPRTYITSQNHGYMVLTDSVDPAVAEVSHVNVNDGTCEGLRYKRPNCFTTQFHPEANAGPKDTEYLFNRFIDSMGGGK